MKSNSEKIATENCCVEQVINSIFENVASNEPLDLQNRSDHQEIMKFSSAMVEGEFIFGSPSEDIIESINQRISSKSEKSKISK